MLISSLIQEIILKALQKISPKFCYSYTLYTEPFYVEGKVADIKIAGKIRGESTALIRVLDREVKIKVEGRKIRVYYNVTKEFDMLGFDKLIDEVSSSLLVNKEGLCRSTKKRLEVRSVEGIEVQLTDEIKEKLTFILTPYFGREIEVNKTPFPLPKGVRVIKIVAYRDYLYIQFLNNQGAFWYGEFEDMAKKSPHLLDLIKLKREIMSTLKR
ncbi:MAG: hypothetical protein RXR59_06375 [Sulfolobus sp.]